ncbi:hypothetical protein AU511_16580 [Lonsdalea iberica]|uniref:Uncharacterized protein n=1 Tax=Lonsdalea iberica TaxID=1082703 RepID=A0A1X3RIH9_9GAMM|nr:hypothetical protein AU511_16580 [Lonsdalea iberica]
MFDGDGDYTVQICCRIVLYQLLMYGMTHDVAHMLSSTCRYFQQTFFLNTSQKGSEVSGFQFRYRLITDRRKNMIVQAGKQAAWFSDQVLLLLCQPNATVLKLFAGERRRLFSGTLLRRVDI